MHSNAASGSACVRATCTPSSGYTPSPATPGGLATARRLAAAALPLRGGDGHRQPAAGLRAAARGCGRGGGHLHDGPGLRRALRLAAARRAAARAGCVQPRTHAHAPADITHVAHARAGTLAPACTCACTCAGTCMRTRTHEHAGLVLTAPATSCTSYSLQATWASRWSSRPTCSAACLGARWPPRAGSSRRSSRRGGWRRQATRDASPCSRRVTPARPRSEEGRVELEGGESSRT